MYLVEEEESAGSMSRELMLTAKQLGFCDRQIAQLVQSTEMAIRYTMYKAAPDSLPR